MADKPKPLGKPNPKLPMYTPDKGEYIRGVSPRFNPSTGQWVPPRVNPPPRTAAEAERRLQQIERDLARQRGSARPTATYPRRESLTPRGATSTTPRGDVIGREERITALRDKFAKESSRSVKPGVREVVKSAVRSNARKFAAGLFKYSPPIAAGTAAHDLVGILVSGDRALAAKAKVMREQRYTRENYGTESKARRSRIEGPRR